MHPAYIPLLFPPAEFHAQIHANTYPAPVSETVTSNKNRSNFPAHLASSQAPCFPRVLCLSFVFLRAPSRSSRLRAMLLVLPCFSPHKINSISLTLMHHQWLIRHRTAAS